MIRHMIEFFVSAKAGSKAEDAAGASGLEQELSAARQEIESLRQQLEARGLEMLCQSDDIGAPDTNRDKLAGQKLS